MKEHKSGKQGSTGVGVSTFKEQVKRTRESFTYKDEDNRKRWKFCFLVTALAAILVGIFVTFVFIVPGIIIITYGIWQICQIGCINIYEPINGLRVCCFRIKHRVYPENGGKMESSLAVIGVGGAGCCIVDYLSKTDDLGDVDFVAIDTDPGSLETVSDAKCIQIGKEYSEEQTVEDVQRALSSCKGDIEGALKGHAYAVIIVGAGGITGEPIGDLIRKSTKDQEIITGMIICKPFRFESNTRGKRADAYISKHQDACTPVAVVENQKLLAIASKASSMKEQLELIYERIHGSIKSMDSAAKNNNTEQFIMSLKKEIL